MEEPDATRLIGLQAVATPRRGFRDALPTW
jgi:hypothetical protein